MRKTTAQSHEAHAHQTVTPEFRFEAGGKAIRITTTDQKLSGHAGGQATFWSFPNAAVSRVAGAGAAASPEEQQPPIRAGGDTACVSSRGDRRSRPPGAGRRVARRPALAPDLRRSASPASRPAAFASSPAAQPGVLSPVALEHGTGAEPPRGLHLIWIRGSWPIEDGRHQEGVVVGHTRALDSNPRPSDKAPLRLKATLRSCGCALATATARTTWSILLLSALCQLPHHLHLRLIQLTWVFRMIAGSRCLPETAQHRGEADMEFATA